MSVDLLEMLVGRQCAQGRADRISYVDPDLGDVSYGDLREAARGYAGALRAAGIPAGARAVVVADDSAATVVAVLGSWWHGAVPAVVSPMLTMEEIRYIVDDCEAAVLHLDATPSKEAELTSLFAALPRLSGADVRAGIASGRQSAARRPDLAAEARIWQDDAEVLLQYTSGSTGVPKGVRHGTGALQALLAGFGKVQGLRDDDIVLATARMSFGYGFGSSVLLPLAAGARCVLLRGAIDVHAVAAALERHRPTVLCSVPRMYAALNDAAKRDGGHGFASVRLCVSAGEHCPAALNQAIRETFGAQLINGLGATELLFIVIATPPSEVMLGSIGVPVADVTASVRDEHGQPVADDVVGRLHVVGPTVAQGYVGRREAAEATFADGGVYTGDLVVRTNQGSFDYCCRTDDVLNLGGYTVAPKEIENVVREADGVKDCVVVGAADAHGLEQAVLYVVRDEGADDALVLRAIASVVRTRLAPFKRPARVELLAELPVTSTGKLAKFRLREREARA